MSVFSSEILCFGVGVKESSSFKISNKIYEESIIYLKSELSLLIEASSNGTNFYRDKQ